MSEETDKTETQSSTTTTTSTTQQPTSSDTDDTSAPSTDYIPHHEQVVGEDGHLLFDPEKHPEKGILKRPGETTEKKAIPIKVDPSTVIKDSNPDMYIDRKIEGRHGLVKRRKSGINLLAKPPPIDDDSTDSDDDEGGGEGKATASTGTSTTSSIPSTNSPAGTAAPGVSVHEREKSEGGRISVGDLGVNGSVDDKDFQKKKEKSGGFFAKKHSDVPKKKRKEKKEKEIKEKDKDKDNKEKEKDKDKDKEKDNKDNKTKEKEKENKDSIKDNNKEDKAKEKANEKDKEKVNEKDKEKDDKKSKK